MLAEPLVKVNMLGMESSGSPTIRKTVNDLYTSYDSQNKRRHILRQQEPLVSYIKKYNSSRKRYEGNHTVTFFTRLLHQQPYIKELISKKLEQVSAAPDAASKMECVLEYMSDLKAFVSRCESSGASNIEELREHAFDELVHDFQSKLGDNFTAELELKFHEHYNSIIEGREAAVENYYQVEYEGVRYYQ